MCVTQTAAFVAVGRLKLCDIAGSDSSIAEDSTPLGFDAVSLGKYEYRIFCLVRLAVKMKAPRSFKTYLLARRYRVLSQKTRIFRFS